jgi:hypothetical protein
MKYCEDIDKIVNKKTSDNFIKIKFGKNEDFFNNQIDIRLFEFLLKNTKRSIDNPQYKKYNKYYDSNNVFIMNDNGYELYYTNIEDKICKYILDNGKSVDLNVCIYKKLDSEDFDMKYKYDKILNIESIYFNQKNCVIEFNKINDLNKKHYEINIVVKNSNFNFKELSIIMFQ